MMFQECEKEAQHQSPPSQYKADLHIHTIHSDGVLTPKEIIEKCSQRHLKAIAITDHDNVQGVKEAIQEGAIAGIEVITGVELSVEIDGRDIHILGYCIDIENTTLQYELEKFRTARFKRAERMVEKLNAMNIPLSMTNVLEESKGGAIGRPHIANALLHSGFICTYHEAFTKYIGTDCPAYETKIHFSPQEAIELIKNAGGVAVIAHPAKYASANDIQRLIKMGIDGIETIHPSNTMSHRLYYEKLAKEHGLLTTGGSDYHGVAEYEDKILGVSTISYNVVEQIKQRLQKQ